MLYNKFKNMLVAVDKNPTSNHPSNNTKQKLSLNEFVVEHKLNMSNLLAPAATV